MIATPTIRALRADDAAVLAGVVSRAYTASDTSAARLAAYLRMRKGATFVAQCAGVAAGMVVGNDYGPVAYVAQMAVEPVLARRGIGTALMEALIAWADRQGFAAVELAATAAGAPLYARYGFFWLPARRPCTRQRRSCKVLLGTGPRPLSRVRATAIPCSFGG